MTAPDFTVTYFIMTLGDADATTGQYKRGFTPTSITMVIIPKGSSVLLSGMGYYARTDGLGLTNYNVSEGDIVLDALGNYWQIMARRPEMWGNVFVMYSCDLARMIGASFIYTEVPADTYYGFEKISETDLFEDGFERGFYS